MPLKTHKTAKKHPHHYAKVYWPYIPLVLIMGIGLWFGHPVVERSQRGILAYSTDVNNASLLTDTNQARQNHGQTALQENQALNTAAQAKAEDMAAQNYWSHVSPNGSAPWK